MNERKLKPLFLIKPKAMSREDIKRVERMCGICVAECSEPETSRYSEPPMTMALDTQAAAALRLMRIVLRHPNSNFAKSELTRWFVDELTSWNAPPAVQSVKGAR